MCDLHPFLVDDPKLVRLLKEIAMNEAPHKPTLVLVSHAVKLPAEVQRYAARFSLALPTEEELLAIVREEAHAGASETVARGCAPTTAPCSRWSRTCVA